jgi:hypothetical protein
MKKISTLGFAVFFSVASFAAFSPNRLTVSAEDNTNIKVTIDGNRFEQPTTGSSITVENLQPGFHSVSIFRVTGKRFGMFGRRDGDDYRLVYTASVNIKPLFATSIAISRSGRTQVMEEPMRGIYDDRKWGNGRRDDHRYYDQRNDYGRNSGYSNIISDADFFAAERVMERETITGVYCMQNAWPTIIT